MRALTILTLVAGSLFAAESRSLQSIYMSLDPTSIFQHFAFYELYPNTDLGKEALSRAWVLLQGKQAPEQILPSIDIKPLIQFVNRNLDQNFVSLKEDQLELIESLASHLKNRNLKGFGIWDVKEMKKLPSEEIDLARALFLAELEEDSAAARLKIRTYEAHIDLMALQLLARIPDEASPQTKIRIMNEMLFNEMRFRFPPHSLGIKEIDLYTFLPSVLDSRRGVCLGVSILYLCLAQRLDLHLEVITPPGHIYVRYANPETGEVVNIETTARGIDLPSETYLGIETKKLHQRTIREVVGMAFMNQAAVSWHRGESSTTIKLYERASQFLAKDDYLLNMFLGFNYLFAGRVAEGKNLLKNIQGVIPDYAISPDTVSEDFLNGRINAEGIQAIFQEVDETRASILKKQKRLEQVLKKYPDFRQGIMHLAITYLQLGREKEALPYLTRYAEIYPQDPTAQYYLAAIHLQRFNYNQAWKHLQKAEAILERCHHYPRALKDLRKNLQRACPEPAACLSLSEKEALQPSFFEKILKLF